MPQTWKLLLFNRLEKDIEKIAFSLNFPLNVTLSSKFYLRKGHIEPNGFKYRVFAFCVLIFTVGLYLFSLCNIRDVKVNKGLFEFDLYSPSYIIHLISCATGFIVVFILDIVHKDNIVIFILMIEDLHKNIGLDINIQSYIIWNWVSTIAMMVTHISLSFSSYDPSFSSGCNYIINEIVDLMCIGFDNNVVISIRFIILLRKYLEKWIKDVLMIKDEEHNDHQCRQLLRIYKNILDSYNLYKKIFQVLILYRIFCTFQRGLCYVNIVIYVMNLTADLRDEVFLLFNLGTFLFLTKDIVLMILQSVYCEMFYMSFENAKVACIRLIKNRNHSECHGRLCKNVNLASRSFSKMTACGLIYVDAKLPIYLLQAIVNFVIIHLQYFYL